MILAAGDVPAYLAPTAALVVAAAVTGYLSVRARVVPIVGFLFAGVLIGPTQLGLVPQEEAVTSVADIGVVLLLFTIGIEFSLERLMAIRRYVLVGGGLQVLLATLLCTAVVALTGATWGDAVFTGFLVALSSTAIVLAVLPRVGGSGSRLGGIALAVLVFQDLAVVAMVLVVPLLGDGDGSGPWGLVRALGTALAVVVAVLVAARRLVPPLLEQVARACSPEVFLLAVLAICFGTAYLTALAGVSVSLGAFLAGLLVSESRQSAHALGEVLPLQVLFAAAFFVSVGMLLDVGFVLDQLPLVLLLVVSVLVVKVLSTTVALLAVRAHWRTALAGGLLLAQVGEFSFVLLSVGEDAGLSPAGLADSGRQALIAATVLLMAATPLLAAAARRVAVLPAAARPAGEPDPDGAGHGELTGHVVVIGYGAAALAVADDVAARGVPVVLTTLNPDGAREGEAAGHRVVPGDPSRSTLHELAGTARARLVVIAEDDQEESVRVAAVVRGLTDAPVMVRPVDGEDVAELHLAGASHVVTPLRASGDRLRTAVLRELVGPPAGPTVVDTARVVDWTWPDDACPHGSESRPVLPSSPGCEDCLREGATWVHLRICLHCGHVGCCDSSPGRHARAHHDATGHPLIASVEPGEDWGFCYLDRTTVDSLPAVQVR
ncbi:cation:proton antiporter [Goekera deserti]|uniref:cation:proton antiporter domain-containing protein n=1 Tax=Goekera deserti TaxID=2497753 RepID=UPI00192EB8F6|nr:cation:proton antiporter [Goekera deserti]